MAIYELSKERMKKLSETSFEQEKYLERDDLQRLLRDQIEVVTPEVMIVSEEFCDWEDSYRSIDLLGLDKKANLVVFELKRTKDGGHIELQAIRYVAMVSTMTFDQVVDAHANYLRKRRIDKDARQSILDFLEWTEADEDEFGRDVSIVLVSADFSKELTTAVMWLNQRDLDIRCVRLKPYKHNGVLFLDIQQVMPLPEASEYQVRVKQKEQVQRTSADKKWDEAAFMDELLKLQGAEAVSAAREIVAWSQAWADHFTWGGGPKMGSYYPVISLTENWYCIFSLWTYGTVELQFQTLKNRNAFKDIEMRRELMNRINRIPGVEIAEDRIESRPGFRMALLSNPESMSLFKDTVQWAVDVIRSAK